MMKSTNFALFLSFSLLLFACEGEKTTKTMTKQDAPIIEAPIVGADSDIHGCKSSAGYQWSILKNECIRLFESGIRLDAKAANLDKSLSAFLVFKTTIDDDAQVEVFIPNVQSFILNKEKKESAGTWKNESYTVTQWKGMYTIEDKKKTVLYQGMAVK